MIQNYQIRKTKKETLKVDCNMENLDNKTKEQLIGEVKKLRTEISKKTSESEERFRYLADASMEAIFFTKDGICLEANQVAAEMFGYDDPSQFIGMFGTEIIAPDSHEIVKEHMLKNITGTYEAVGKRRDGTLFPIAIRAKSMPYKDKGIVRATSILDITEHKYSEEALRESEEKLRFIINNSDDVIFQISPLGIIKYVSTNVKKLYGYEASELIGKHLKKTTPIREVPKAMKVIRTILSGKSVKSFEINQINKFGDIIPMEINFTIVKEGKKIILIQGVMRDITERKRAKKDLAKKTMLLDNIINRASNVAIATTDLDLCITSYNPIAEKFFGYAAQEVLGKTVMEMHLKEKVEAERLEKSLEIVKKTGEYNYFVTQDTENGKRILSSRVSGMLDTTGTLVGYVLFSSDVTELILAEEALRESENNLRTLFNAMTDIVFEMDYDGRYINIAPTSPNLMFKPPEKTLGKTLYEVFPKPQADKHLELIRKCLDENKIDTIEYPLIINDKTIWFEGKVTPKTKNSVLYIARDITKHKVAEAKMIEARDTAELYLDMAGSMFVSLNGKGEIILINQKGLEILGYNNEELIGKNWFDTCIPPEINDKIKQVFKKLMNGDLDTVEHYVNDVVTKSGELRTVSWYNSFIRDETGKIKYLFSSGIDITERKQAEENLIKAKEKAEESDRLKTAFLHNISHEIRTPMNGILGFTDLLLEPGLSGEQQHEYIEVIKNNSDRMLNTINDLMDISIIESGQMKISISEVNLNEQNKDLYTFFKPEAEKKGMNLIFINSLPVEEAIIKTDREKIYAILTNLIKNAIKYSNEGIIEFGYNLKHVDQKMVGEPVEPVELEFFVKDKGIGIPKDRQQAIFDRFVQADIEDIRVFEGSGLGLSISKAYAEMLGGRIWVESEDGIGSQFYFTIPYNPKTEEKIGVNDETPVEKKDNQMKGLKVLIAEDVESADKHLSIVLKKISKEILHAKTGIKTVELCRKNPDIDLILMDIRMPEMNGYEATRKIREFNKDVIIIAQTAYALAGDHEKALEAGCDDYISKPINKDKLLEIIEKYFNKK